MVYALKCIVSFLSLAFYKLARKLDGYIPSLRRRFITININKAAALPITAPAHNDHIPIRKNQKEKRKAAISNLIRKNIILVTIVAIRDGLIRHHSIVKPGDGFLKW
jgi:hypothetical protein